MSVGFTQKNIDELVVTIVGGGNAAHALAALLPHKGISTRMWAPFSDEAERLQQGIAKAGHIHAEFASHNLINGSIIGTPEVISAEAAEVIPGSDVLLLPLPSFAYWNVFEQLKPYLKPGMAIGITPGQGGVDWVARQVLGDLVDELTIFAIMPMPFNCRISEFGVRVEVQEVKRAYKVACIPASSEAAVVALNEHLFGKTESCGSILSAALYPINAIIHPARLYQLAKDYKEGDVLPENPLFYEQMDAETAAIMNAVNQDLLAIGDALKAAGANTDVPHIFDFLTRYVYSDPSEKLEDFFTGNPAYKGFRCPFAAIEGGFKPDFANRYFTEDIPLGLCLYKGVAELAGVATPNIDEIINWAQAHMGKEYLVDNKLVGKDVIETHAPQRFAIDTLSALLKIA
ncbi:NAD/NADP octopine/nopaline dehydrogenase family protein [Paraferrimonas sp. SM1919]|uniref:NAD/NADP octopine/nopaline dehydrogenase family protein n=1 Tax=Paraferrimonas sp. SM1919 TaxID=2662263 RepID=UPI0013D21D84|nr:NAD/NADP octopine/nopaline dehydrogenase family protein [Paraferrimonas sp. SM1919]